jgi:K+-sensing histidine kinase KdpD
MPKACHICQNKICQKSSLGTLDFCDFGIAFYNDNGTIQTKEEAVTLKHVSHNLRHELNKVLQLIISEAAKIDPQVTTKSINTQSPASRIVGATIIIDQFIEMIAGVNEFHPSRSYSTNLEKKANLHQILNKYTSIYSLIQNTRRAKNIEIKIICPREMEISFASQIVEYIFSIFIDNMWKYSLDNSKATIEVKLSNSNFYDIVFTNDSMLIENTAQIFNKGFQENSESEGFGYGLYWASILARHYNELGKRTTSLMSIEHSQYEISSKEAKQIFTIRNIRA